MQLPGELKFNYFDAEGNMQEISVDNLTKDKKVDSLPRRTVKRAEQRQSLHALQSAEAHAASTIVQVVLFAVPGAFTPTCSLKHLPGFIEKAHELKVG